MWLLRPPSQAGREIRRHPATGSRSQENCARPAPLLLPCPSEMQRRQWRPYIGRSIREIGDAPDLAFSCLSSKTFESLLKVIANGAVLVTADHRRLEPRAFA